MILDCVQSGKIARPILMMLYGVEGIGKSTFASTAPRPIYLGAEQGADVLDVPKFPMCKSWEDVLKYVDALIKESHNYKTLVIDTIDSLEPLLWEWIKKDSGVESIELAAGGFGKGYVKAQEEFMKFREKLDLCRDKGMNIVLVAHSLVAKVNDPVTNSEFDTYRMKLHKRSIPVFVEWVDALCFANYQIYKKTNKSNGKDIVYGDGERVMFTEKRPSFDAKNRFSLPFMMNLSFEEYAQGLAAFYSENKVSKYYEVLIEEIKSKLSGIKDETLLAKINDSIEKAGTDESMLTAIRNRVNVIIGG